MEQLAARLFFASDRYMRTTMCDGHMGDLRPGQYMLLRLLCAHEDGEFTPTEISQQMELRPPSVTPVIDRLEGKGYLCRTHSRVDRRKVHLTVTPQGRAALEVATRELITFYSQLVQCLSPEEAETLIHLLAKVSDSVCNEKGDCPC